MAVRAKRLERVAGVVDRRYRTAVDELRRSRAEVERHRATLAQLLRYKREYADRHGSAGSGVITGKDFKNLQAFLKSLDQAIHAVRRELAGAAEECDRRLEAWRGTRSLARAVRGLVDRHRADERRRRERGEQVEQDDRNGNGQGSRS